MFPWRWKTLNCFEVQPNEYYLWTDLSVPCYDDTYYWWRTFALAGIGVYTVGTPTFFLAILWRNNKQLVLQTPHLLAKRRGLSSRQR